MVAGHHPDRVRTLAGRVDAAPGRLQGQLPEVVGPERALRLHALVPRRRARRDGGAAPRRRRRRAARRLRRPRPRRDRRVRRGAVAARRAGRRHRLVPIDVRAPPAPRPRPRRCRRSTCGATRTRRSAATPPRRPRRWSPARTGSRCSKASATGSRSWPPTRSPPCCSSTSRRDRPDASVRLTAGGRNPEECAEPRGDGQAGRSGRATRAPSSSLLGAVAMLAHLRSAPRRWPPRSSSRR